MIISIHKVVTSLHPRTNYVLSKPTSFERRFERGEDLAEKQGDILERINNKEGYIYAPLSFS